MDGKICTVVSDDGSVCTPGGRPFATKYEELADLLCEDLERFGKNPQASLSYVTLHCSYLDFGCGIPKAELVRSAVVGYDEEWDIALQALNGFDKALQGNDLAAGTTAFGGFTFDPFVWFGEPEGTAQLKAWFSLQSVRALCSAQCCAASCRSVLVAYRLLNPDEAYPATRLVGGLQYIGADLHPDAAASMVDFFGKAVTYAAFGDDHDV
ncbi:MAG: hypothetical protein QNL91_15660 [Candidatus Krumholzibacteria bacterium]|nr:hypothetical protein [Candidatus Krumholzibacteria bacterium]